MHLEFGFHRICAAAAVVVAVDISLGKMQSHLWMQREHGVIKNTENSHTRQYIHTLVSMRRWKLYVKLNCAESERRWSRRKIELKFCIYLLWCDAVVLPLFANFIFSFLFCFVLFSQVENGCFWLKFYLFVDVFAQFDRKKFCPPPSADAIPFISRLEMNRRPTW